MNRRITVRTGYRCVTGIAILIIMLLIYPFAHIGRPHTTRSEETETDRVCFVDKKTTVTQLFGVEGDRIKSIEVSISGGKPGSSLELVLLDNEMKPLLRRVKEIDDGVLADKIVVFPVGYDVEKGASYYIQYRVPDIEEWRPEDSIKRNYESYIEFSLEDHALTTATANSFVVAGDMELEEYNLIQRYHYRINFEGWQVVLLWIVAALLELAVLCVLDRRVAGDRLITIQRLLQATVNPVIAVFTLAALIAVFPMRMFGSKWFNIIFWDLGIVMLSAFLLFLVNYKRTEDIPHEELSFGRLFRIAAVGGMLWQGFMYVNGLYDIHHTYAYRKMLIWFMLFMIGTYDKEELWSKWRIIFNLAWTGIGAIIGYNRYKPFEGDIEQSVTYRLEGIIIVLGGIVVINMAASLTKFITGRKAACKNNIYPVINLRILIPLIVFLGGMIVLANTREWPVYLAVICFLLAFRLYFWKGRNGFSENIISGVIFNFILMVVYSLRHRPYYYYRLHRYSMGFHTVTVTAVYMTMVLAAVGVRLFIRSRQVKDRKALAPELALFGIAADYMLFTLSRTGYLSVIIMLLVSLAVLALIYDVPAKRAENFGKRIAITLGCMLVAFPVTFSATRIVPAVADDPIVYDYEHMDITMYRGTPKDSEEYMDIYRFMQVFGSKVLGVGDTVTDGSDNTRHKGPFLAFADVKPILASAEYPEDTLNEFSNGRIDIYRSYIEQSNLWGHDSMGAILPNGEEATHAHNTFLQAVFDHGWIFGIYFSLYLMYCWFMSVVRLRRDKENGYRLAMPVLLSGMMAAGLVEWVFHPCYPICISMMMLMMDMIFTNNKEVM